MPAVLTTSRAPISYRVAMSEPASHELEVEMTVPALPGRDTVDLVFPAWAPGSYLVRDFVRHVYELKVTDGRGRPLDRGRVERIDKQRWRIATDGRPFRVSYRVFAFEASVRTSFLDASHAYWNGTSLFFYVDGELARPCRVTVVPPPRSGWRVASALASSSEPSDGFRTSRDGLSRAKLARARRVPGARLSYLAADFDELVDAPFEVGRHETHAFSVGRTRFELALYGRSNADRARLIDILRRVVTTTGQIFGGFPFDRYLFIVHALPVGSGGLEHRASVTMDIAGLSFEDEAAYHRFADLAAHEFFHAWNVKRIHDAALGPFDYTRENYTRMLWLFEGFTDYLAHVIILRAGITRPRDFFKMIAEDWPKYATRPGRNETPLDELSFEAWIKQYKPAENFINRAVSYYEKGFWTGMALDLELRIANGGRRGLPELFRRLWDRFGRRGQAIDEADVREAAAAVAGRSMDRFFNRHVHGTGELPLPALLAQAGVEIASRAEWDESGKAPGDQDPVRSRRARAWTGLTLHPDRTTIRNVVPDSPGWRAGLTFGDELVALDGARVTPSSFAKRVGDRAPGERVRIAYFRRDQLEEASLTLALNPERRLSITPAPKPSQLAAAVRAGWLGVRLSSRA